MKTHEFVKNLIDNSKKINGIRPLHFLEVAEENGKYYLSDSDAYWEHIPEDWNEFVKFLTNQYEGDIRRGYEEGQYRLRQATKELLGIRL